MVRVYKKKLGARTYRNWSDSDLREAADLTNSGVSLRQVAKQSGISRCAIRNFLNQRQQNAVGRPTVFSEEEENCFHDYLTTMANWRFPLTRMGLLRFVKIYVDKIGLKEARFKDNAPGNMDEGMVGWYLP